MSENSTKKFTPSRYFPLQAATFEGGLALAALVFGWLFDRSPGESIRLTGDSVAMGIAAIVPLLAMLLTCRLLASGPVRAIWRVLDEVLVPMFRDCHWIELAAIALLAGVGEELLFRGLIQSALAEWTSDFLPHTPGWACLGDWLAVLTTAIIFGALHAVNAAYAVLAALMGVYLGWLFLATGNLAVPIIAHGLYDFIALMYVLRRRK